MRPPNRIITDKDEVAIVEAYEEGISAGRIISDVLNNKVRTTKTIYDILRKWDVPRKGGVADYNPIDHGYFLPVNTPAKAYVLGWIVSDGWIHPPRNQIGITLQHGDKYIVEMIRKELKTQASIVTREGREMVIEGKKVNQGRHCQLIMHSKKVVESLENLGVRARKSQREVLPSIDESLVSHLVRGILDGDGCIYRHSNGVGTVVKFIGSACLTGQISWHLSRTLGVAYPVPRKVGSVYQIEWYRKSEIPTVLSYIYKDATYPYVLWRKYEKCKDLLSAKDRIERNFQPSDEITPT